MEHQTLILIGAAAIGFYMAWSIGANDVANAMGTVVGSGSLSLRKAVLISGTMDCLGAILVGSQVTATIQKGVVDPCLFAGRPELMMWGMFSVLIGAATLVTVSTYFELPVSTTHAIVGSVTGFGLVSVGPANINWTTMGLIVASWFISPVFGGVVSYLIFAFIKKSVFNKPDPFLSAKRIGPYFVSAVFFVLTLMTLYKGLKPLNLDLGFAESTAIAAAVALASGIVTFLCIRRMRESVEGRLTGVEKLAQPLQIVSAATEAFAHGANDVANAIGPLMAIVMICQTGSLCSESKPIIWVLVLGGVGIMIGTLTWGYKVMATLGTKITEITPTRGFAAEFGTAATVLLASRFGLPVSTTHVSVGNVVGVGLARGYRALNFSVLWSIAKAWAFTVPASAILTIVIYIVLKAVFCN